MVQRAGQYFVDVGDVRDASESGSHEIYLVFYLIAHAASIYGHTIHKKAQ
jgi:hypothetical protein